ncbi:MAG TPA: aromatic ring-hydroxylating dioxygenase subunit alpha [Candidatus Acidoferrum sp.]|nr:aromatic ring-hydroxylating dioxygenase subunit alpha [Candidatus Acidoferrum sp.]
MELPELRNNLPDLRAIGIHPDFWYPVALARDLKPRSTLGVSFAGEPIVLARTDTGSVFALEDRCAHRQVPLHLGVVQGEQLKCSYHAWCYDSKGKLSRIPYLADGGKLPPEARGVRSYPCRQACGLIFIFPGAPEMADHVPLPELPEFSSSDYRTMYFSREVKCHYTFMHENLMDMNHQFLHRSLMGSIQPVIIDYRSGDTWVEARYKFEGGQQHVGADFLVMGGKDETAAVDRDYELMTIRTDYPHQGLTVYRANSEIPAIRLWASYVPLDAEQRRNRSFGLLMIRRPKIPGLLMLAWPVIRYFAESVFTQDRLAVEQEQNAHDAQGGDWNREVSPVLLELRRVLAANGITATGGRAHDARPADKLRAV